MKKILLISHSFPPFLMPESILVSRALRVLDRMGWQITVLTVQEKSCIDPIDPGLLSLIPRSVRIVRARSAERLPLKALTIIGMPEEKFPWYFTAASKGKKLLRTQQFDIIYSRACYHTSNIVGLALKRASGLPWVAHFSDPWVDSPYFPKHHRLRRVVCGRIEKAIIQEADSIVFTTKQTVDMVMSKYPRHWQQKAHVIPHGYDPKYHTSNGIYTSLHKRLRLVYTGSFYIGKRTPIPLFKALHKLNTQSPLQDQLEVIFVGHIVKEYRDAAEKFGLNGIIEFRGLLPFEESLKVASEADVLLVFDAPSKVPSVFLPSKLIDYLAFRKPIIGVTPLQGASSDLLRRLGCVVVDPRDISGIAAVLTDCLKRWKLGDLNISTKQFDSVANEYNIRHTTQKLTEVFEKTIIEKR